MEEKDKRFLVFGYDRYYPNGGMGDCFGTFDTIEEAKNAIEKYKSDFYEIYDRVEGVIVSYGI